MTVRPLKSEERPWGSFTVYLENKVLRKDWTHELFELLSSSYPPMEGNPGFVAFRNRMLEEARIGTTTVKIIRVNPESRLSLQYHDRRAEEWLCLKGEATATLGTETRKTLREGDSVGILTGMIHRLASRRGAEVLEVAKGTFDESDIVRIQDDYARPTVPENRIRLSPS
jgi:mannose-6-phosphate isomerase